MSYEDDPSKRRRWISLGAVVAVIGVIAVAPNLVGRATGDESLENGCGGPPPEAEPTAEDESAFFRRSRRRARLPDLQVSATCAEGILSYTAKNYGFASAPGNVDITVLAYDLPSRVSNSPWVLPSLPRHSRTIADVWVGTEIDRVTVKIDPHNRIRETNDRNNITTVDCTVAPRTLRSALCDEGHEGDCNDVITTVMYPRPSRMFVTRTSYHPKTDIRGTASADRLCQQHANSGGLGGHWISWLSTRSVNAVDRVRALNGLWSFVRAKDRVRIARNVDGLVSGSLIAEVLHDERGIQVWSPVWTGTNQHGVADATCDNWTSDANDTHGTYGFAYDPTRPYDGQWTASSESGCGSSGRLYCIEYFPN